MMVVLFACYTLALALSELSHGVAVVVVVVVVLVCLSILSLLAEISLLWSDLND